MLWTSTDCWQASKIILVRILPCLRRYRSWSEMDNVSKRERNLALAQESLQWRKQQASHVYNLPPDDRLQGVESAINNLKTRQFESHQWNKEKKSSSLFQSSIARTKFAIKRYPCQICCQEQSSIRSLAKMCKSEAYGQFK